MVDHTKINQFQVDGFKILQLGFDEKLFLYHKEFDFEQSIFISFDNIILSVNSAKNKSTFIFNDDFVEDAKSKKSETKFIIDNGTVKIQSTGPDSKNKLKTVEIELDTSVIDFISDMLYKYMFLIEGQYRSCTDDATRKSLRKRFDKVVKFLDKGFICD